MKLKITSIEHAVEATKAQGWEVRRTNGGHWQFVPPDKTKPMVHGPSTPSDWRSIKNTVAQLVRSGLDLSVEIPVKVTKGEDMPSASPSVRAEKIRVATIILRYAKDLGLSDEDLGSLIGQSSEAIARWRTGGLPRMAEDSLREAANTLASLKAEREKVPENASAKSEPNVPTPSGPGTLVTVGVQVETKYTLDLSTLSMEQLAEISRQCIAELVRRGSR